MASSQKYLNHLLQGMGITPACSEEERTAADDLAAIFRNHGFDPEMQEFNATNGAKNAQMVLGIALFIGTLLLFGGGFALVLGILLVAAAAVVYVLERSGRPVISGIGNGGLSQNVIAYHKASGPLASPRNRPVVVVAHYDSPRADLLSQLPFATYRPLLTKLYPYAMLTPVVAAILRLLPLPGIVTALLGIVALVAALVPFANAVAIIANRFVLPYTSGAVCNKSSVAAMLGVMDAVSPYQGDDEFPSDMPFDRYMTQQQHLAASMMAPETASAPAGSGGAAGEVGAAEPKSPLSLLKGVRGLKDLKELIPRGESFDDDEGDYDDEADDGFDAPAGQAASVGASAPQAGPEASGEPGSTQTMARADIDAASSTGSGSPASSTSTMTMPPIGGETEAVAGATAAVATGGPAAVPADAPAAVPAAKVDVRAEEPAAASDAEPAAAPAPTLPAHVNAAGSYRYGIDAIRALGMLDASCRIEYEDDAMPEPPAAPVPVSEPVQAAPVEAEPAMEPEPEPEPMTEPEGGASSEPEPKGSAPAPVDALAAAAVPVVSRVPAASPAADDHEVAMPDARQEDAADEPASKAPAPAPAGSETEAAPVSDAAAPASAPVEPEPASSAAEASAPEPVPSPAPAEEAGDDDLSVPAAIVDLVEEQSAEIASPESSAPADSDSSMPGASEEQPADSPAEDEAPAPDDSSSEQDPSAPEQPRSGSTQVFKPVEEVADKTEVAPAEGDAGADKTRTVVSRAIDTVDSLMAEIGAASAPAARPKRSIHVPSMGGDSIEDSTVIRQIPPVVPDASALQGASALNRASLFDIPDPSVAPSDPFAVNSVPSPSRTGFTVVSSNDHPAPAAAPDLSTLHGAAGVEPVEPIAGERRVSAPEAAKPASEEEKPRGLARFFGRKGKKKQESMSEWLGVDDDFDAKRNGGEIGGWDNFDADEDGDGWKGGATGSDEATEDDLRDAVASMGDDELLGHDIWFVATGASECGNAGIRAFLGTHRDKLRGVFLINLESVGAGHLSLLATEGESRVLKGDKRIMRLAQRVSSDFHHELGVVDMPFIDTDAHVAMEMSLRALTVAGVDAQRLACSHTEEDQPFNIDASNVQKATDVVTEVIRRS